MFPSLPPPPPGGGCMMCKCPCERAPSKTWPTSWQTRGTTTCSAHCTPFLTPLPPNQPKDIARNAGWTRCSALGSAAHLLKWKLDRSDEECAMCFGSSSYTSPLPGPMCFCGQMDTKNPAAPKPLSPCQVQHAFISNSLAPLSLPHPAPAVIPEASLALPGLQLSESDGNLKESHWLTGNAIVIPPRYHPR